MATRRGVIALAAGLIPIVSADPVYGNLFRDEPDVFVPLLRAEADYLEAMFGKVEARHGLVENYLEEILGVTGEMRESIRRELVE